MAKRGTYWSQQTLKEKVESLHIRQQRIVRTLNLLARRIEPDLKTKKRKGAKTTSKNTKVTLAKGGTQQTTKPIKDVKVPDLWHIAESLRREGTVVNGKGCADRILDTWHLAHDLHRHIMESP